MPHITFSKGDPLIIAGEINRLLEKGVITKTSHCDTEFISTVFTRAKRDGSHRLILNLKKMNEYVSYPILKWSLSSQQYSYLKKDYWMAVLDLKDA